MDKLPERLFKQPEINLNSPEKARIFERLLTGPVNEELKKKIQDTPSMPRRSAEGSPTYILKRGENELKNLNFNYVVDHGELMGYNGIIYVDKDGNELEFEEWQKLTFEVLNTEGSFFLK
jgi:hypothetical protein